MRIASTLFDEMVAHACGGGPEERCGIIASRDGVAIQVYRARNALSTPRYGYRIDDGELYRIVTEIEGRGLDLGAIYHSHPRTEPVPSPADVNLAKSPLTDAPLWPGTIYVIVGFSATEPAVRAWHLRGDEVSEAELIVE
jgi:proteasome lid subunit RPN8/RPN11